MASLTAVIGAFNANEVAPSGTFEPLPAGDYPVAIVESAMKPTAAGNGQFLELKLQVLKGEYQNRFLFDRLNLVNQNQKAVDIARGTLSAICRAVGVLTPGDSSELHNKPLVAVVKLRNREDTGEPANDVRGYKPTVTKPAVPSASETPW